MSLIELTALYETDKRFKRYVDRYAAKHRTSDDVAIKDIALDMLKHKIVKEYAVYLKECDQDA